MTQKSGDASVLTKLCANQTSAVFMPTSVYANSSSSDRNYIVSILCILVKYDCKKKLNVWKHKGMIVNTVESGLGRKLK